MSQPVDPLPPHYAAAVRLTIRFASLAVIVAILAGLVFREATKMITFEMAPPGVHLETVIQLALVHGHVFVTAVLLPLAMAGALLMARRVGGRELGKRSIACFTHGYLTFVTGSLVLMLVKGYQTVLGVRRGEMDFDALDKGFLLGDGWLRIVVYGVLHAGMGICLGIFVVALWRSLKAKP